MDLDLDGAIPAGQTDLIDCHWLDDPASGANAERLHIKSYYRFILDNLLACPI